MLIVDDNIFNIITLETILDMQFKIKVDKAMNGADSLEKVRCRQNENRIDCCTCEKNNHNYKLIFMDCNMPIMDGFEASNEIRSISDIDHSELKIFALTANTNESFRLRCQQSGMDGLLTKPISAETIQNILLRQGLI